MADYMPFGVASPQEVAEDDPHAGVAAALQKLLAGGAAMVKAPGQIAAANPYPPGSEQASWYEDQRAKGATDWAPQMAMSMVGGATPFGVPVGAGEAALGSGAVRGIKAYHGSPHDFDAFSMDKIGTGEGAQAYGHGRYMAENEATAKSYKAAGPASDAQYDAINTRMSQLAKEMDANSHGYNNFKDKELGAKQRAEYDGLMEKRSNLGHMYEVNINADPEHFLDWDKPLSKQHPTVQDAAKKAMGPNWDQFKYANAGDAVKQGFLAPGADTTAARLHEAGIPGIKYLDQGSRASGDGSRNYVVFNDKLIDILKKYGIAGLLGGAGGVGALGQKGRGVPDGLKSNSNGRSAIFNGLSMLSGNWSRGDKTALAM